MPRALLVVLCFTAGCHEAKSGGRPEAALSSGTDRAASSGFLRLADVSETITAAPARRPEVIQVPSAVPLVEKDRPQKWKRTSSVGPVSSPSPASEPKGKQAAAPKTDKNKEGHADCWEAFRRRIGALADYLGGVFGCNNPARQAAQKHLLRRIEFSVVVVLHFLHVHIGGPDVQHSNADRAILNRLHEKYDRYLRDNVTNP